MYFYQSVKTGQIAEMTIRLEVRIWVIFRKNISFSGRLLTTRHLAEHILHLFWE